MLALLADATTVAFVALGGTVIGGLIGAATQIVVTRASARTQAEMLRVQAEQEGAIRWRDERHEVYSAFAQHAYATQIQIEAYCDDRLHPSRPTEQQVTQILWDLEAAWARLSILAGPHLTETARGITSHLWECFVDAPSSEEIFVVRPPKISDEALVAAIKAELGIKTIELMPSA